MNGKALAKFLAVIALIFAAFIYFIGPLAQSIKQGLDLQGGTHIVLEAEDAGENKVTDDAVERARQILERRINEMGLAEPLIQREGKKRIIIELPGVKDPDQAIKTIGKTAVMEFKDENGTVHLTGNDLKDAKEQIGQNKQFMVAIEFTDEGAKKFADLTTMNVGRHIGIYLDGEQLTNPVVNEPITGGKAVITGSRTLDEAKNLAILLRSGALPVKVNVLEVRTVGPTLGQDSKDKSVTAFAVGIGLIVAFYVGIVPCLRFRSDYSASHLRIIIVGRIAFLAGYLNTAGDRRYYSLHGRRGGCEYPDFRTLLKEEVQVGKTLRMSMESGFRRALATIVDANMSVMITAAILFVLGSGPVRGFAITLGLGVAISMVTAVFVSRYLLRMLIECNLTNHPFWYGANVSPTATMELYKKGGKNNAF